MPIPAIVYGVAVGGAKLFAWGSAALGIGAAAGYVADKTLNDGKITNSISEKGILGAGRDAIRDVSQGINDGLSQVGPQATLNWFYSAIENFAKFFNSVLGGESLLDVINWARKYQAGENSPLAYDPVTNQLTEANSIHNAPDLQVSDISRDDYKTAFNEQMQLIGNDFNDPKQVATAMKQADPAIADEVEEIFKNTPDATALFNALPGMTDAQVSTTVGNLHEIFRRGAARSIETAISKSVTQTMELGVR